jgi:ZIP family zinc transporter
MSETLIQAIVAGILASLACGLGVIPLMWRRLDPKQHAGLGYAAAGGLMVAASVLNLILPALQGNQGRNVEELFALWHADGSGVGPVLIGLIVGALFLDLTGRFIERRGLDETLGLKLGGATGLLIFLAMCLHSIPEGVAVGVGYVAGDAVYAHNPNLGHTIALAIAIHNIPEGLAVAIPLRAAGVSFHRCFWLAVLTSVPQPIAAVPAVLAAWFFAPLVGGLMGFAAGAMIFLVVKELIPEALERVSHTLTAWAFLMGFAGMTLVQVIL